MTAYLIQVRGCDDMTEVVADLADEERAVIGRIAAAITDTSTYGCMPVMTVTDAPPHMIGEPDD